jgi:hypothetical protein
LTWHNDMTAGAEQSICRGGWVHLDMDSEETRGVKNDHEDEIGHGQGGPP